MSYRRDELKWNGWGLRRESFDMKGNEDAVWRWLGDEVGVQPLPHTPAKAFDDCDLPASGLADEAGEALLEALRDATAADRVKTDAYERAFHAYGRSYPDLLRLRGGELSGAPDAIVYPRSAEEVQAVLRLCADAKVSVVPFGGGTSVVGGVEGKGKDAPPSITVDTTLLDQIIKVDPVSLTATIQAGIYGPALEKALQERGYTLGHYPQSFEFSTLGGWIAARGAGQQSNRYGAADEWLVAATLITPTGQWRTLPFPHSAAGPNLNELIAGSEGTLGIIVEATVKVHPVPAKKQVQTYLFRSFEAGAKAIRRIVQNELPVAMMRLSDAEETHFYATLKTHLEPPSSFMENAEKVLGFAGYGEGRCVMMVGFEGEDGEIRSTLAKVLKEVVGAGGLPVGSGPGKSWYERRFASAYLRDPMMDRGVAIDTLETSTTWSNVQPLYHAVRTALRDAIGPKGGVMAHISHSYPDGCSLYFIFVYAQDLEDPMSQWVAIKRAASQAISDNGGTISHHHGVGRDHAEWFAPEKGELGVALLKAAKKELDPEGTLNPGKLLG